MVVLGIVLIVLAVVFGLGVSVSSSDSTTLQVFGVDFGVIVPTVFFLGAAAGVALILGLWLTKKGLGRGYRRHKEVRELRQQAAAAPAASSTEVDVADDGEAAERPPVPDDRVATARDRLSTGEGTAEDRLATDDRLATGRHTVADGTESKQSH
jgi:hypothetical protein